MLKRPEEILAQLSSDDQEAFDLIVEKVSEELNRDFRDGKTTYVWVNVHVNIANHIRRPLEKKFSDFGWVISINDSSNSYQGSSTQFKIQEKPPSHILKMGFD